MKDSIRIILRRYEGMLLRDLSLLDQKELYRLNNYWYMDLRGYICLGSPFDNTVTEVGWEYG